MKKRAAPTQREIAESVREFWKNETGFAALLRARARILAGEPLEERDRVLMAQRLQQLANLEAKKIRALSDVQRCAHVAEYLVDKLRMPLDPAARAFDGVSADSIRKAVDRLRAARRTRAKQKKGTS